MAFRRERELAFPIEVAASALRWHPTSATPARPKAGAIMAAALACLSLLYATARVEFARHEQPVVSFDLQFLTLAEPAPVAEATTAEATVAHPTSEPPATEPPQREPDIALRETVPPPAAPVVEPPPPPQPVKSEEADAPIRSVEAPPPKMSEEAPPPVPKSKPRAPVVAAPAPQAARESPRPAETAPAAPTSPPQVAAAPATIPDPRRVATGYERTLLAWLERYRDYPRAARQRRLEGRVVLRLRLEPDGRVAAVEVLSSSGADVLDAAAVETTRRASPFPPLPPELRAGAAEFTLPVVFRLPAR